MHRIKSCHVILRIQVELPSSRQWLDAWHLLRMPAKDSAKDRLLLAL